MKERELRPYPVNRVPSSRGGPQPIEYRSLSQEGYRPTLSEALNGLSAVLLGAIALVTSSNEVRREEGQNVGRPNLTAPIPEHGIIVEDIGQYEKIAIRLKLQAENLKNPDATKDSPLFKKDLDIRERCRLTSDWFLEQDERLEEVWQYLVAHKTRWPNEVNASFDAIHQEIASMPWLKHAAMPKTQDALEAKISHMLARKKPFTCGIALSFVTNDDIHKAQKIGVLLMDAVARFILTDIGQPERRVDATKIAKTMREALKTVVRE